MPLPFEFREINLVFHKLGFYLESFGFFAHQRFSGQVKTVIVEAEAGIQQGKTLAVDVHLPLKRGKLHILCRAETDYEDRMVLIPDHLADRIPVKQLVFRVQKGLQFLDDIEHGDGIGSSLKFEVDPVERLNIGTPAGFQQPYFVVALIDAVRGFEDLHHCFGYIDILAILSDRLPVEGGQQLVVDPIIGGDMVTHPGQEIFHLNGFHPDLLNADGDRL